MARTSVTVSPRSEAGKGVSHRLRAEGMIPAVVYGKGRQPIAVVADPKQLSAVLNGSLGKNTPIELSIEGEAGSHLAIIKDYQVHAVKRRLTHVDFWQVEADQKLVMTVPFRRAGRSLAEKQGGKIRITRDDINVACVADLAPAVVEYDMATLKAADANIHISEVPLPEGVEAVFKHDYSLVQVSMPRVTEAAETADPKAKKGKK